ncbi:hypothetical protein GP486_002347 [Trichoglossum hirsutum]|uniref:Uncharacterized protein n=1 Tax=Trichoglossum hirsutum TaxID=265104 RepID=A0A9P8RRT9_9PEZI|nr:hypothetical protein GP486_002347 [Trichoglossum hirsutum]
MGTKKEHIKEVQEVLELLNKKDFKLSLEKCHVAVEEVEFLGVIINQYEVGMNSMKVKVIKD